VNRTRAAAAQSKLLGCFLRLLLVKTVNFEPPGFSDQRFKLAKNFSFIEQLRRLRDGFVFERAKMLSKIHLPSSLPSSGSQRVRDAHQTGDVRFHCRCPRCFAARRWDSRCRSGFRSRRSIARGFDCCLEFRERFFIGK